MKFINVIVLIVLCCLNSSNAQDTFYYHNDYLEMILSGPLRVYLKQHVVIKDILKKGAFGTTNRNSAIESYSYVVSGNVSYDLIPDEDLVLQKISKYYYSTSVNDFIQFNRKNIIQILPGKEDVIKNYLKSNKIDFESGDDLLRLAGFLSNLLSENPEKL